MELWRRAVSDPPEIRSFRDDKPTLLISWWCTLYAIVIIVVRVLGRYIRTERMFAEDGSMLLAIIPLLLRMAFVHVVLLYGTNNTVLVGLTAEDLRRREIGSRLVLASRVMYAAYLWTIKYSVSMFLRTLTESAWSKYHRQMLQYLHIVLAATFLGTVISVIAECQPFPHYWQVSPDPGPKCRQGHGHLVTAGVLNILTNLILVVFALPMIWKARLPHKDKFTIFIRLALPLVSVALTCYQIPTVVAHHFLQPLRSLLASLDILIATFISNAIVLLSLLQDRGYKKAKYKHNTVQTVFPSNAAIKGGRGRADSNPQATKWGSDENLVSFEDFHNDRKSAMISMEVLSSDKRSRSSQDRRSVEGLSEPEKAKFQEIRIASTWEVSVSNSRT